MAPKNIVLLIEGPHFNRPAELFSSFKNNDVIRYGFAEFYNMDNGHAWYHASAFPKYFRVRV